MLEYIIVIIEEKKNRCTIRVAGYIRVLRKRFYYYYTGLSY